MNAPTREEAAVRVLLLTFGQGAYVTFQAERVKTGKHVDTQRRQWRGTVSYVGRDHLRFYGHSHGDSSVVPLAEIEFHSLQLLRDADG